MADDLIGKRVGQYEIIGVLGMGGMATVYRARQANMRRDVAIKVIKPGLKDIEQFARRFEREAQTVATLNHPHILKVFDYGQQEDMVYLVMELQPGGSLEDLIRQGAMSPDTISHILDQIASALDYAHRQGIIHRDLKPHNVLLDGEGNAILTDFGIAKVLTENTSLTQSGAAMGTPSYMSPEQWHGRSLDARADIYALGVMLFEMLTGQLPFMADTPYSMMTKHVNEEPPPVSSRRPELPASIDSILKKALAKDPAQRFSSAGEIARVFKAALAGERFTPAEGVASAPTLVEPFNAAEATATKPRRSNRPALLALGAVLIIIVIVGIVNSQLPKNPGVLVPTSVPNTRAIGVAATTTSPATSAPTTAAPNATATPRASATTAPTNTTAPTATTAPSATATPRASATTAPTATIAPSATATRANTAIPTTMPTAVAANVPPGAMLYSENFEDGLANGWLNAGCGDQWSVITEDNGNRVYQGSGVTNCIGRGRVGSPSWNDYVVELRFKRIKGATLEIAVRAQNIENQCALALYPAFGDDVGLRMRKQSVVTVFNQQPFPVNANDWNTVQIEVRGDLLRASINGRSLPSTSSCSITSGFLALILGFDTTILFDDIRIWSLEPSVVAASTSVATVAGTAVASVPQQPTLYSEDFEDGVANGWEDTPEFQVILYGGENGRVWRTGEGFAGLSLPAGSNDYALETKVMRSAGSAGGVGLYVRVTDAAPGQSCEDYYMFGVDTSNGHSYIVRMNVATCKEVVVAEAKSRIVHRNGEWFTLRFEAQGKNLRGYIDGILMVSVDNADLQSNVIALGACCKADNALFYFDEIRVVSLGTSVAAAPTIAAVATSAPTTGQSTAVSSSKIPFVEAGNGVVTTFRDDFNGTKLSDDWAAWSGTHEVAGGYLTFKGRQNYDDGLGRNAGITNGMAMLILFQHQAGGSSFGLETGDFATDSFHGLSFNDFGNPPGKWDVSWAYNKQAANGKLVSSFNLRVDAWYYLLMGVGSGGRFIVYVWERDNPSKFVVNAETTLPTNQQPKEWAAVVKVYGGTVKIDSYTELRFPANFKMPASPPQP